MEIKELLTRIKAQQDSMGYTAYIEAGFENRMNYLRDLSLALVVELSEMLQNLPWKPWKAIEDQPYDLNKANGEYSDIMVFLIDIFLTLNPTLDLEAFLSATLDKIDKRITEKYGKQN